MLPLDPTKPVKIEGPGRAITPRMVELFFKHAFKLPEEFKYYVLCLVLATTGIRNSEARYMQLQDFEPGTNFTKFKIKVQKKKNANVIKARILPEAVAAIVRAYIKKNYLFITSHNNYLFSKPNNRGPVSIQNFGAFFSAKRQYMHTMFPEEGFMDITRTVILSKPTGFNPEGKQKLYRFCPHSFRHFYSRHISADPELAKNILGHDKLETTMQYRHEAELLDKEEKLTNELFNDKFYDAINNPGVGPNIAIWQKAKSYEK